MIRVANLRPEKSPEKRAMVCIGELTLDYEAEILTSLFESEGIRVVIQGRNHRRMLGFVGTFIRLRILVEEDDESKARALLQQYYQNLNQEVQKEESIPPIEYESPMHNMVKQLGLTMLVVFFLPAGAATLLIKRFGFAILFFSLWGVQYLPSAIDVLSTTLNVDNSFLFEVLIYLPSLMDLAVACIVIVAENVGWISRSTKLDK